MTLPTKNDPSTKNDPMSYCVGLLLSMEKVHSSEDVDHRTRNSTNRRCQKDTGIMDSLHGRQSNREGKGKLDSGQEGSTEQQKACRQGS